MNFIINKDTFNTNNIVIQQKKNTSKIFYMIDNHILVNGIPFQLNNIHHYNVDKEYINIYLNENDSFIKKIDDYFKQIIDNYKSLFINNVLKIKNNHKNINDKNHINLNINNLKQINDYYKLHIYII
jgi:hypothetical protein